MLLDGYTVTIGADVGAIRVLKRRGALVRLLRQVHNILIDLLLVEALAAVVLQGLFGTTLIGLCEWGMLLLVAVNVLGNVEAESGWAGPAGRESGNETRDLRSLNDMRDHEHSPEAIQARLAAGPQHSYLRDWVYGGIDGAVTTFAIVSAVAGAQLSAKIVLVLGVANLLADGFSMAASNYLGTRAEHEEWQHLESVEQRHIDTDPEGEREEIRQIYQQKGLEGAGLDYLVEAITADRERWVRTMLSEEYGLPQAVRSPWLAGMSTFSAFVLCGLPSLLPFFFGLPQAFWLATGLTAGVFFTIGSVKSRWSPAPWWRSGLSTLGVGLLAAGLAYGAGLLLKGII